MYVRAYVSGVLAIRDIGHMLISGHACTESTHMCYYYLKASPLPPAPMGADSRKTSVFTVTLHGAMMRMFETNTGITSPHPHFLTGS